MSITGMLHLWDLEWVLLPALLLLHIKSYIHKLFLYY